MSFKKSNIPPSKRVYLKAVSKTKPTIISLPDEILLCIFGHLEPSELVTAACVCRQWLQLSKDNLIWRSVYERYVHKNVKLSAASESDETPASYWRDQCIKCGIERRNKKIFHLLKKQNHYTKLPFHVQNCLTKVYNRWQLTFLDPDDQEYTFVNNDLFHFQTSLTVRWSSLEFPPLNRIKKVKLHSLNPVFYIKDGVAHRNSPLQRSLLLEPKIKWPDLSTKEAAVESGPLRCYVIDESILVAVWKEGGEIAFFSVSLHYNKLVERCLLGSSDRQYELPSHRPYRDDIDARFGLHGYSCIAELRNQRNRLWMDGFSNLFSSQSPASGVQLTLINPADRIYHQIITKPLSLPWKTELFKGIVEDCCLLDLTLIDAEGELMWCISVPVVVRRRDSAKTDFELDGQEYYIQHRNDKGDRVYLSMNKDESRKEYSVTSLQVELNVETVNDWFGTRY